MQELFYGAFRSVTKCPTCDHVSLKYESFSMLSLPIPQVYRDEHMAVCCYYVHELCLFDLVKVECSVHREETLRNIRDGFAKSKGVAIDSMTFYYYTIDDYKWIEIEDLDLQIDKLEFPDNHYFFIVQHRSKLLGDYDNANNSIRVYFKIWNVDPHKILGLRKLTKISKHAKVSDLYKFFYDCLNQTFDGKLDIFDRCFSSKDANGRLFDLYHGQNLIKFESDILDSQLVYLQQDDEIIVEILHKDLLKHNKLNSLNINQPERYPEDRIITLENCLESLTNPEQLDKDNMWYCEKCKDHKQAKFQLSIKELPRVLIIHLKRFKKTSAGPCMKLSDYIDFPMVDLNLSKYTDDQESTQNTCTYSLYGMINHSGSANFGHYTGVVQNWTKPGRWLICDDENVVKLADQSFPGKNRAYILFYKRNDQLG